MVDRLATHPKTSVEVLTKVARGAVAAQWARNINQYRADGLRQKGTVVVRNPTASKLSATRFRVAACVDVSKVNLVDKNGKSVVASGRIPRVAYSYTVQKDKTRFYVIKERATGRC